VTLRVLVTGATGFLGSHTLAALRKRADVEIIAACRSPERLPDWFAGEVRQGDLTDPDYRAALVEDVDVICHCGTWGAFWGHAGEEQRQFREPTDDLLRRAVDAGVGRFLLASTVAIGTLRPDGQPIDDFSRTGKTGFWPHLDHLVELDTLMQRLAGRGTEMVTMRLGHFVGTGLGLGIVPALIPRLKTRMVPWLAGGRARLALVAGSDLGEAFAAASCATGLDPYESFNICGPEFPTTRQVFSQISQQAGVPAPLFSVPRWSGYAFGWLMEALFPLLPGKAPFLTRSLVHVSEDWFCATEHARRKLGFSASVDWRQAVAESISERRAQGFPWPALTQAVGAAA
jgi:nucleoside-diphosphate-sugar epimerase